MRRYSNWRGVLVFPATRYGSRSCYGTFSSRCRPWGSPSALDDVRHSPETGRPCGEVSDGLAVSVKHWPSLAAGTIDGTPKKILRLSAGILIGVIGVSGRAHDPERLFQPLRPHPELFRQARTSACCRCSGCRTVRLELPEPSGGRCGGSSAIRIKAASPPGASMFTVLVFLLLVQDCAPDRVGPWRRPTPSGGESAVRRVASVPGRHRAALGVGVRSAGRGTIIRMRPGRGTSASQGLSASQFGGTLVVRRNSGHRSFWLE